MTTVRRLWDAVRRYLPAEVAGTVAALVAVWAARRAGCPPYGAALAGSGCETAGYYGVILAAEVRATRSSGGRPVGRLFRALPGVLVEFGPAEFLDTVLLRPALMAAGPLLTGQVMAGTLAGKLAADALFYAVVLPCRRLRRRGAARYGTPADGDTRVR